MSKPPLINLDALPPPEHYAHGKQFESSDVGLSELIGGGGKLGYAYTVVPPGKRACPFHNHWEEEELFFIVRGSGLYRFGTESYPVRAGDVIAAPAGGQETAHQLINNSEAELCYLSISSKSLADVVEYPDSGKMAAFGRRRLPDGRPGPGFRFVARQSDACDYFDGEA